jgi:hypothetical protein
MSRISIFAIGKLPKEYSNLQDHFLTMLGKDLSLKEILPKKISMALKQ